MWKTSFMLNDLLRSYKHNRILDKIVLIVQYFETVLLIISSVSFHYDIEEYHHH
jgi:hypothetical protein